MKHDIKYKPSYSMLVVKLDPAETITAEAGALTYMTPNIDVKTRRREHTRILRFPFSWCIGKYKTWSDAQCKSVVLCIARAQPAPYLVWRIMFAKVLATED